MSSTDHPQSDLIVEQMHARSKMKQAMRLPGHSVAFWISIAFVLAMVAIIISVHNTSTLVDRVVSQNEANNNELTCRAVSQVNLDIANATLKRAEAALVVAQAQLVEDLIATDRDPVKIAADRAAMGALGSAVVAVEPLVDQAIADRRAAVNLCKTRKP